MRFFCLIFKHCASLQKQVCIQKNSIQSKIHFNFSTLWGKNGSNFDFIPFDISEPEMRAASSSTDAKEKVCSSSLTPPRFDCFLNSEKPFLGQQFDICEFSCQNISLFNDSQQKRGYFLYAGDKTNWVRHNVRKCANVPRRSRKSLIHTDTLFENY